MQGPDPQPLEQESLPPALEAPPVQIHPIPPPRRSRSGIAAITTGAIVVVLAGGIGVGLALTHHIGGGSSGVISGTNDPNATGCPGSASNVQWSHPASVTLTMSETDKVTTVSGGAIVDFELPSGYRWMYAGSVGATPLNPQNPAGSYRSSLKTCEWRFTAPTSSGLYVLTFVRRCLPVIGKVCSDITINYPFLIQVG